MATLRPLLALCRVSNLPTVWMNVVAAAMLSARGTSFANVTVLALAMSAFYCGGMALNDLCDLEYDRVHQRYRPIPAGRVTVRQAWIVTIALFAIGLAGLALLPHSSALAAGLLLLLTIWIYDRYHKQYSASVLVMAIARLLVYVVAALALVDKIVNAVWLAAILQALYVLLLTVVARFESHTAQRRYSWPVIPWLIAAMPLIDGAVLAVFVAPFFLLVGMLAMAMTRLAQRYVRGD